MPILNIDLIATFNILNNALVAIFKAPLNGPSVINPAIKAATAPTNNKRIFDQDDFLSTLSKHL
jgi:hypothetical protein